MYKSLIDAQSIQDQVWLKGLDVRGEYDEQWPGEEIPVLHMVKVAVDDEAVAEYLKALSRKIDEGWFSVTWNDTDCHVVLKDTIFNLKSSELANSPAWESLISYGQRHEIDKKYFINMLEVMKHCNFT